MKVIALGTGPFAVPTLRRLHDDPQHEVLLVVTRPPRGRRAAIAPMALAAQELELPLWQPDTVNEDEAHQRLKSLDAQLMVVCDYGEILKPAALECTSLGGVNLHGSLLPKYRGAAPVQWAVFNGDQETGNTVIQMTPGLDAGPILGVQRTPIDPHETAGELEERLAEMGATLVEEVIAQLATDSTSPVEQDSSKKSKAPRLAKEHGLIDWSQSAQQIHNQVRALQPWPRAYTHWEADGDDPQRLIVHRTRFPEADSGDSATPSSADSSEPGTITSAEDSLIVATGEGVLELLEVQPAGKRAMPAGDFLRGNRLKPGDSLS
ncbi:methionyl-tRNA formyltransferase [Adhaeretor mobilis]|uniref:Methionyl-tRNA formyltransferase n=1 Tax=Adhaeretor mobilis TaxID=1930276 RepID=A0A517N1Q6_9BACT|nr:methionyl-tRNA formyltransferase [Adhaeretor mobilis]QDT01072.1 Methionyl-tRNA formyltransferase [Adhaeretor mobilis]